MGNYHTATVVASATAAYRLLFYHITNPHLVDNQLFRTMPRSGIKYAGGVLRALTGGCYRGAVAPLGLSVTHIHSSPEGISAATLQRTASEEMPSGQQSGER